MADTQQQGGTPKKRDQLRTLVVTAGVLAMLGAAATAVYWVGSEVERAAADSKAAATAGSKAATTVVAPGLIETPQERDDDVVHADVYFDFKSTRLTATAVGVLQANAPRMTGADRWVVLVQGQADLQGPPEYNRNLALRRAETVKHFLVELGVPGASIKVVTMGPEGALCEESTKECQKLNRRVHLEMRKLATIQS
jgi:outer membrane protein OmpA-like peptidoglycan-associated protein